MNQSKLEAIVCSKARENLCERVTIGFCFTSDWMKKRREFITRGGGLKKVLYGEAPPRGPNPYPFIYHYRECLPGFIKPIVDRR